MIFVLENGKNTVGLSVVYWIHTSRSEFTQKKNITTDRSVTNSCTRHGHVQENPYMVGKIQTFYEDYRNISNKIIILDCPLLLIAFARFRCFSIKFIQCSIFV